jgi:signal transduction histidine kinase
MSLYSFIMANFYHSTARIICALIGPFLSGCFDEIERLEKQLADTENQIAQIPKMKVDSLVPTLGYSSAFLDRSEDQSHITVHFSKAKPIDTLVLVPFIYLDTNNEYAVSGFPLRFRIEATTEGDTVIEIVDHTKMDFQNPGIAPVIFNCTETRPIKSLKIIATKLAKECTWRPDKYIFCLNELLVFSGDKNIALNARVSSSSEYAIPLTYAEEYLVDGYTYFPHYSPAEIDPNKGFHFHKEEIHFVFDLGEVTTLDEVRLYPSNYNPQHSHIHASGIGFPSYIQLKMAPEPYFENVDPTIIANTQRSINFSQSPLSKRMNPHTGRYVQIVLRNGRKDPRKKNAPPFIALSEIELLRNGHNRVHNLPLMSLKLDDSSPQQIGPIHTTLTDGNSALGKIIAPKQWYLQMATLSALQHDRTSLSQKLKLAYSEQSNRIQLFIIFPPILICLFTVILLFVRHKHIKSEQLLRERIADDLHDEVGATLNGIANAGELLKELYPPLQVEQNELLRLIVKNSRIAAEETRSLVRFLEHNTSNGDLFMQIQSATKQLLYGYQVETQFGAYKEFNNLAPIVKWDLLLMMKEIFNNIVKHADASSVKIITQSKGCMLEMYVSDDGIGLKNNQLPEHLLKRALKIKAHVNFVRPSSGGTTINIVLNS